MNPIDMTLEEWMSKPRSFEFAPAEPMTLDQFRSLHGYHSPMDDHGGFRFPHGISKAQSRRNGAMRKRWFASSEKGRIAYEEAKANGTLSMQKPIVVEMLADGSDSKVTLAMARVYWKHNQKQMKAS